MIYLVLICLVIIGFLGFKLYQKQTIDRSALANYKEEISKATQEWQKILDNKSKATTELENIKSNATYERYKLDECRKDLQSALDMYQNITDNKLKEIDISIESQRQKRQEALESEFNACKEALELELNNTLQECDKQAEAAKEAMANVIQQCEDKCNEYYWKVADAQERFNSIEKMLAQYEKDKQAKLFYTIQLPDEYKDDIEFLLTTVAPRLLHKDIIYKLIWNEYIKSPFDDLIKRIKLQSAPGIYKITNITDEKCYIGKSTDVKKRLTEHIKGALGLSTISDQEIHHAIKEQGFDNWTIEVITYCEKEKLNELEKYYIEFFKSQEWGYNKRAGG